MELIAHLIHLVEKGDRKTSLTLIDEWIQTHPGGDVVISLLDPFLNQVGMTWQQGEFTLAQAYVATKIAEDVINRISRSIRWGYCRSGETDRGNGACRG